MRERSAASLPNLGPTPADAIYKRVKADVGMIKKAKKSANLKGTFVRTLNEAAASIVTVEDMSACTGTQEPKILKLGNTRLHEELDKIRKELVGSEKKERG